MVELPLKIPPKWGEKVLHTNTIPEDLEKIHCTVTIGQKTLPNRETFVNHTSFDPGHGSEGWSKHLIPGERKPSPERPGGQRRARFPVPKSEEGQVREIETVNTSPEPPRSARRNENDAPEKGSKGKTVKLGGDKQGNQPLVVPRIRTRSRTETHRRSPRVNDKKGFFFSKKKKTWTKMNTSKMFYLTAKNKTKRKVQVNKIL